jgi:hypothetical protein
VPLPLNRSHGAAAPLAPQDHPSAKASLQPPTPAPSQAPLRPLSPSLSPHYPGGTMSSIALLQTIFRNKCGVL